MGLIESGFVALAVALAAAWSLALRSWWALAAGAAWLVATGALAQSGWLTHFDALPPRLPAVLLPAFAFAAWLALGRVGDRLVDLPLALLIGFQTFRIPTELLIHRAVEHGIAPVQMSWSGLNWDIASGVSALLLMPLAHRLPTAAIAVWNGAALVLLLGVVVVTALSVPGPLQRLHPDNTWIADFPFFWLPSVLVCSALAGHMLVFRKLLRGPSHGERNTIAAAG